MEVKLELVVEATASLKKEIEKELQTPDPTEGTADLKQYKEVNGQRNPA
jgi:hypothetical protein